MTKQSLADWYDEKYGKKPSAPATPAAEAAPTAEAACCGSVCAEAPVEADEATGTCCAETAEAPAECCAEEAAPSLYEQLGGEAAVDAAVDIFYRKVLSDERINQFFDGLDMEKQAAKQKAFLTFAFGGPNNYSGLDMRKGHAHLVERGLNDSHFDAVMEHLGATLVELNVPENLIAQAAAIAESTRNDVLGK